MIKIPGYKIERLLAEGGMATVYLATQISLGRHVALKLLKKFDNANQSKRFLNEGQVLAAMNHRNIITIYDIGVTDDERPYISMEYLEGGDLEARIERGMDPKEALCVVDAIGDCLSFVHRKGIVHRDIKPANILFHKDGTPILSDFGVAKQEESDARLTMDGLTFGSPYYLSPEQAECKALDGRADIYGLGIVLYEMLTGNKPYKGDSHIETIIAHLSEIPPLLPPELSYYQDLVQKMMAKSQDDRFATADEMVQSIRRLRGTETVSSSHISDNRFVELTTSIWIVKQARRRLHRLSSWADVRLRKPLTTSQRLLSVSVGGVAILLAITGTLIWMQQPVAVVSVEHAADPKPTISDAEITEGPKSVGSNVDTEKANEGDIAGTAVSQLPEPELLDRATQAVLRDDSQRVEELLSQANVALGKYRLTTPKSNNAYYYYQQILEVYPKHEGAIKGIDKIVNTYADLAERELDSFNYKEAKGYIRKGLRIQPDNYRLHELKRNTNVVVDVPKRAFGKIKSLFK